MHLADAKTIYFSGIGGIGMSGLAQLLKAEGKTVKGSDRTATLVTDRLIAQGMDVILNQDGSGITDDVELMILSDAVPVEHSERMKAAQRGILTLSYFEALGAYGKQFETMIAVSGTHGKSTTTAMITNIFVNAGLDPTVIVGSIVKEFDSNARTGKKKFFIVEACEHQAHMLHLRPHTIVLTNIDADHLDYYRDIDHIVETFQTYVGRLPNNGTLIRNADDARSQQLTTQADVVNYGIAHPADLEATAIQYVNQLQKFTVGDTTFSLRIPGAFNVSNALASIATARHFGVSDDLIQQSLSSYTGIWRRFQILGTYRGATVVSDYAHHPTEIRSTLAAAKEFYTHKRIVVIFQPHQRSRTQALFHEFATAFDSADSVVIQEIYDVAGREENNMNVNAQQLVDAIAQQHRSTSITYTADADESRRWLDQHIQHDDVLLLIGAGDIYTLAESLVKKRETAS